MSFEIIDFHTHPFLTEDENIANHRDFCGMGVENTREIFASLGVSKICGSVIHARKVGEDLESLKYTNDTALKLRDIYGDFYVPGFHIHPSFVDWSLKEMERMDNLGVKMIGELVPYYDGWSDYSDENFSILLDEAARRNMVVSYHSQGDEAMDEMVKKHKDVVFVAAHPGEYDTFMRQLERFKMSENFYLDISGTGVFRYGVLRRAIDTVGADRILFGSDFPTCSPAMFVGSVLLDPLLSDSEKEKIFSLNAKRILNIK
ncbi:MAG: amidohydrolase [Ruminococcaceae bacterium]|nr:amidohydrolase [Oscillospiraceae bacterium]